MKTYLWMPLAFGLCALAGPSLAQSVRYSDAPPPRQDGSIYDSDRPAVSPEDPNERLNDPRYASPGQEDAQDQDQRQGMNYRGQDPNQDPEAMPPPPGPRHGWRHPREVQGPPQGPDRVVGRCPGAYVVPNARDNGWRCPEADEALDQQVNIGTPQGEEVEVHWGPNPIDADAWRTQAPRFGELDQNGDGQITEDEARAYPPLANDFLYASGGKSTVTASRYQWWVRAKN